MKTLIFSDSHLSETFRERKYNYLSKIIESADSVIINGDFWEGEKITFSQFVDSEWKKLFPLLKSKKAIYIYGNHDRKQYCDKRVDLFSVKQTEQYILQSGGKTFIVEHGHRFAPITGRNRDEHSISGPLHPIIESIKNVITMFRLNEVLFKIFNARLKSAIKKNFLNGEIYVCGHTHCPEVDLKNRLINSGINHLGIGQYVIIEDGEVTAYTEQY